MSEIPEGIRPPDPPWQAICRADEPHVWFAVGGIGEGGGSVALPGSITLNHADPNHSANSMDPNLDSGKKLAQHADLSGSEFEDVNLQASQFRDVNLTGSSFENINLNGAVFKNACFGDVSISDASYDGMRIDGILVEELLRVYLAAKEGTEGA